MWDQKLFELFTTIIPQSFLIIFLFFTLTNIKIKFKSFFIFSIAYSIVVFFVRQYVNFGVHTSIMLFILVAIATLWGKANIISSAISSIVTVATTFICEWITFFFLDLFKFNIELLDNDPKLRAIIGIIPLLILMLICVSAYYIKRNIKKKEADKVDDVRENI